ncbi:hypothetical protein Ddye_017315 [Dipteronia dyeriana]|uniref:Disease resistance protein RGA3 n=1 Tax=Dipteronia dyeriana TaxID=168575 RepID=A0AAD9U8D6_9ROSI|nr:hypothetical protein Ddye_017315 [Dipteronia dyeriana]
MGEVVLASLLRVTLQNLASPIVEELGLLWGVDGELEKLISTLSMIQAVLEDASKWQNQGNAVGVWLARLEDVAYEADDILDEFATVAKLRDVATGSQSSKAYKLHRFFSSLDPSKIKFRHDMAHRIKQIRKRIDEIGKDAFNLHLRENDGWRAHEVRREMSTSAFTEVSNIVGRHHEKEQIISFLAVDPLLCNPPLRIFSIVGVGGLGKTTLAQLVYNDLWMQKYFDIRIWISVSQIFDATQLAKAIIESITLKPHEQMQLNALQVILAILLYGKRYLLVLDNVCDDSNNAKDDWNKLLVQLRWGAAGSIIIITTRSQIVASNMGNISNYPLWGMSNEDCFSVFNLNAFEKGIPNTHPNLVEIGRKIACKCHGLPLAAKTLGRLLNSKLDEQEWNAILSNDIWDLHPIEDGNGILPSLNLSYQHLPSHLKLCFTYCSLFPKGYVFNKDKLVRLWMAEGFIHPEGRMPMELVGQSYFDTLFKRSFFQSANGHQQKQSEYIMHDLIHDLAQSISVGGHLRVQDAEMNNTKKTRRLSICDKVEQGMFKASLKSKNLRTFLLLHQRVGWFEQVPSEMFNRLKRLRVLGLNNIFQIRKLPNAVGDMIHLRYLNLSYTHLYSVPSSICNLYNLQTLILGHTNLKKLPNSIGNLINLGYLDLSRTYIGRLPKSVGNLINLRHLSFSSWRLSSLPQSIGNLSSLLYLDLSNSGLLRSLPESIGNLTALQYLDLSTTKLRGLPESICNLCHLQTLKIESCLLFELPRRTGDLVNLQHLYVDSCRNLLSMPEGIGRLTSLQTLSSFVVGRAPGCGLYQLNSLNNLRGKLHISRLENATNLEEYNLKNKPYISELQLEWSNTYRSNIPRNGEAEYQLLKGLLQPHTNLTTLTIKYYSGTELPSWLGNHLFLYLTTLRLYECKKWRKIPPFGQLPSLKYLEIYKNDEVQYMGQEFSGEGEVKGFPSLEELSISVMSNLEEWVSVGENEYPRLKKLTIHHCDKLRSMPHQLSGVTTMKLSGCAQSNALPVLPNIRELELMGCGENALNSLPQLTSLVSLKIYYPDINSLSKTLFQPLCALKTLQFDRCDEIFDPLKWEGLEYPVSMQSLIIQNFFRLTQLPENGWPTTIKFLQFSNLTEVKALPEDLKNLTTLQGLKIDGCPKLMSLPENGLPPTLEYLHIYDCRLLAKRCKKNRGKDWHKIAHIPHLNIN